MMWLGFKHTDGNVYVCPIESITDVVKLGEAVQLVASGLEPYKVANAAFMATGIQPQMRHVKAHIAGKSRIGRPARPVVCVETGQVYGSVNQAAQACGIACGNLSNHLRYPDVFKTVKGYKFRYYTGN